MEAVCASAKVVHVGDRLDGRRHAFDLATNEPVPGVGVNVTIGPRRHHVLQQSAAGVTDIVAGLGDAEDVQIRESGTRLCRDIQLVHDGSRTATGRLQFTTYEDTDLTPHEVV